jgi:signal peptidase I
MGGSKNPRSPIARRSFVLSASLRLPLSLAARSTKRSSNASSTGRLLSRFSSVKHTAKARQTIVCRLIGDVLQLSGRARVCVSGSSMLPSIRPGDILLVQRTELHEAAPGDVVLFAREDRLIAHRVISQDCNNGIPHLLTCGDLLDSNDSPVFANELLGRVTSILRGQSQISSRLTLPRRLISIFFRRSQFLTRCWLWLLARQRCWTAEAACPR